MIKKLAFVFFLLTAFNNFGQTIGKCNINKELILKIINQYRQRGWYCGNDSLPPAPPLIWDDNLEKAALFHSRDMAQHTYSDSLGIIHFYFSHTSYDGTSFSERIDRFVKCGSCGENIHLSYDFSEQEVIKSWMHSPGHCRNIMDPDYRRVAVGCYYIILKSKYGQTIRYFSTMELSD